MTLYDATGKAVPALAPNAAQESGGNLASVAAGVPTQTELMQLMLRELYITNKILAEQSGWTESDLQALRDDPNFP